MGTIFLTGPKHCGKTSAGKALARLYSCDFIDLDDVILQITGKSPRQLYNEDPEIFKKAEVDALAHITGDQPARVENMPGSTGLCLRVVAAGGGIIDNQEAIAGLNKYIPGNCQRQPNPQAMTNAVVYLNISAAAAWDRISGSGNAELPPFLKTENPHEAHRALHERRCAAYLQNANIVIEAGEKTPDEIAVEIMRNLCQLNINHSIGILQ